MRDKKKKKLFQNRFNFENQAISRVLHTHAHERIQLHFTTYIWPDRRFKICHLYSYYFITARTLLITQRLTDIYIKHTLGLWKKYRLRGRLSDTRTMIIDIYIEHTYRVTIYICVCSIQTQIWYCGNLIAIFRLSMRVCVSVVTINTKITSHNSSLKYKNQFTTNNAMKNVHPFFHLYICLCVSTYIWANCKRILQECSQPASNESLS